MTWVALILLVGFDGVPLLKVNLTESPTIKLWKGALISITCPDWLYVAFWLRKPNFISWKLTTLKVLWWLIRSKSSKFKLESSSVVLLTLKVTGNVLPVNWKVCWSWY